MNPYAFTNLINPTERSDWRVTEKSSHNTGLDYPLSRAFYRIINSLERGPSKRSR